MAGIYIHIPFCKQACSYCNFHFSTSLQYKEPMLDAIAKELEQRKAYLGGQEVQTVYFGGGTPSLLTASEINRLFEVLTKHYALADKMEVTLETNPDDLTATYIRSLKGTPINRFSIGIQSFFDEDLLFMNRAHNAAHAKACIEEAQQAGFEQLTIDLIYGAPTTSHQHWEANLQWAFDKQIPHISCYALTVEPKTALEYQIRKGTVAAVEDEHAAEQFEILLAAMQANDYEQYEISNFCIPPNYALHNSNYWRGAHYLGVGPAAHSFNGTSRQWNIAHNAKYMQALKAGEGFSETEHLTIANQHNEYIMTALRTKWGVDVAKLTQWGDEKRPQFEKTAAAYIKKGLVQQANNTYVLSDAGKLIANSIIADFFV